MSQLEACLTTDFSVDITDIQKAVTYQKKFGGQLEQILVNMGCLSAEALPSLYARLLNLEITQVMYDSWFLPEEALKLPFNKLIAFGWLPYSFSEGHWQFVTINPLQRDANEIISSLKLSFNFNIISVETFSLLCNISSQPSGFHNANELSVNEETKLRELATEAPTVNLLNSIIARALRNNASDMHIEPFKGRGKVRFRIDGVLQDIETIPENLLLPLVTRLKILSNMDIAEKRRPQDGKIAMRLSGVEFDIRVSALPINDGESVVMRFLRKDAIKYDMEVLGIAPDIEHKILEDLQTTAGVILLTGPTGSGKTTSLYTFLNKLNTPSVKIVTLEDPVEYQLDGINQVQVQADIGFDFATGLRSIVRQDPDIIMLGEIRDKETAGIAMQSALTGHLVFSTLHTNDAASAYTRLLDLGVEEFLLNAALISIVAQRLVRCLCPQCAIPDKNAPKLIERYHLQESELVHLNNGNINLYSAVGCEQCNFSGFKGRVAIIEYLRCNEEIKALAKDENFIQNAKTVNKNYGCRTLLEDGMLKAIQGITTIDEVLRVAG